MFKYYLTEMALQGKYKDSMEEFKKNPPIRISITNNDARKELENFLREKFDNEINVRIIKRDKSKTFDSYYEIDLTPLYRNTGENGILFKQIVSEIKSHLKEKHISEHAYELFVKNVGKLTK